MIEKNLKCNTCKECKKLETVNGRYLFVCQQIKGKYKLIVDLRKICPQYDTIKNAIGEPELQVQLVSYKNKKRYIFPVLGDDFFLCVREAQLIYLRLKGKCNPEIARIMGLSLGTVNAYLTRIKERVFLELKLKIILKIIGRTNFLLSYEKNNSLAESDL